MDRIQLQAFHCFTLVESDLTKNPSGRNVNAPHYFCFSILCKKMRKLIIKNKKRGKCGLLQKGN